MSSQSVGEDFASFVEQRLARDNAACCAAEAHREQPTLGYTADSPGSGASSVVHSPFDSHFAASAFEAVGGVVGEDTVSGRPAELPVATVPSMVPPMPSQYSTRELRSNDASMQACSAAKKQYSRSLQWSPSRQCCHSLRHRSWPKYPQRCCLRVRVPVDKGVDGPPLQKKRMLSW